MSLSTDLIKQARHLCHREPRRPRQASLRRAISAAYYGLFHHLIDDATRALVPHRHRELRASVGRIFRHDTMRKACQRMLKIRAGGMQSILGPTGPSNEILQVADAFVSLQQARHEADYDTARLFSRAEAAALVSDAEGAITALSNRRNEADAMLLFVGFLDEKLVKH